MKAGGSYCFAILGATPMAEPLMAYPHGIPNEPALRKVEQGDLVICEMSGSYYGYAGQPFCAVAVGEPPEELTEMADFTRDLFHDLCKVVKPGNTDVEVKEVAARVSERGLDIEAPFIHAWGTHFGHPVVGFEEPDAVAGRVQGGPADGDRAQPVHAGRAVRHPARQPHAGGRRWLRVTARARH